VEAWDYASSHAYYFHRDTGVTQWEPPDEPYQPCLISLPSELGQPPKCMTLSDWMSIQNKETLDEERCWGRPAKTMMDDGVRGPRFRAISTIGTECLKNMLNTDVNTDDASDADTDDGSEKVSYRARANTTSTSYFGGTMADPDKLEALQCVGGVIHAHLNQFSDVSAGSIHPRYRIFTDEVYMEDADHIPSREVIFEFVSEAFNKGQMETECIIMSFAYLERLIKVTNGRLVLKGNNWRGIVLSTLILASKVWDDMSMWNIDFSKICPTFTLKRINQLEICLLEAMKYEARVSASEYARYYFQLRSMRSALGLSTTDDVAPPLFRSSSEQPPLDLKMTQRRRNTENFE